MEISQLTAQPEEQASVVVLFPFPLEAGAGARHTWSPLTMSRSYSDGSQTNTFVHTWLLREIIIKAIAECETNKKIIPNKQGLKTNAGSLKSDEERNETSTNSYHDGKVPVFFKK